MNESNIKWKAQNIKSYSLQSQIIGEVVIKGGIWHINKREVPNKREGVVWKLFSVKSDSLLSLIMGIALAKSWSARGASHQLAFMSSCLSISDICLLSHVFASFAFLMLSVFSFQKMWRSLHSTILVVIFWNFTMF